MKKPRKKKQNLSKALTLAEAKEHFASKQDLEDYKKEAKAHFASKQDLEDYKKEAKAYFASKQDLLDLEDRCWKHFASKEDLKTEIQALREDMMTKKDKNEIMTLLDIIVKDIKDIKTELVANIAAHQRYDDYGRRIERLEYCVY